MTTRSLSCTIEPSPPDLPPDAEILGRAGTENFKVASMFLPRSARRHLICFYGFARLVDEVGDSYSGDRLAALDWLERETRAALLEPAGRQALVAAAAGSIRQLEADPEPLFDLIEANRLDQRVDRYPTFEDLLGYCALSANPVGRLVLAAFGFSDARRIALSDSICTGLQLVEHWQDVAEDAAAGRVYLPVEDLDRFGVDPESFAQAAPPGPGPGFRALPPGPGFRALPPGPGFRALMVFEVARARRWLDAGRPLAASLPARARFAVAGFWAGGHAALDAIAARRFDVTRPPGRAPRARLIRHLARGLAG